ncbi:MAG: response regulator [Betaproteobacteria bacterium]|nr:response regulator [Betaproteobacteria bacterium]
MAQEILIVDDEIGIRELLSEILMDEGYEVVSADGAIQARALQHQLRPRLVLLDIWMPDMDGISLLKEWKDSGQLTMPVLMMSGHGTIDTAVEAVKIGAVGFLEKPIALKKLLESVSKSLQHAQAHPVILHQPERLASVLDPDLAPTLSETTIIDASGITLSATIDLPLREARDLFERQYFARLIAQTGGNVHRAAELAGLERTHLYRKLKQLGVPVPKFPGAIKP